VTVRNLIQINEPREISRITELIHDYWLDASLIVFDSEKSTLSIRCLKGLEFQSAFVNRFRFPAVEYFLRISRVESFSVEDKQKVRFYDVVSVAYDATLKCVELRTGVPIGIKVFVTGLDLTVEETGTVVQG
jgi:hypothetical protein